MARDLEDLAPSGFVDRARRAADVVDSASRVRILSHYDPDGTSSAAILAKALLRRGKRVHATMSHVLDRVLVDRLRAESNEVLLVSDMGSAQLDFLETLPYPVVVLDHHRPLRDSEKLTHVNPHLFGIDGAREMCGATTAWLFALTLDERNWDLAGIAAVGAVGDKQDLGGFRGPNASLFGEAVERKILVPERRLALRDRPLAQALALSIAPYFRGLGGRLEAAESFLRAAGFDPKASLRGLDVEERRRLASVLATKLIEQGAAPEALEALIEDRYWSEPDQMYVQDLEAYVDSCDRLEQEGLGMAVCLGDRDALVRAEALVEDYTSRVLRLLQRLEGEGLFTKKHIQFFYCEEPNLAGPVAGSGIQYYFEGSRPVLGLSVMEGKTKISARGTRGQTARGIDLAAALREAAEAVGGEGGGHNIAAGATIPKGMEERFLAQVDVLIGRQVAGKAPQ